MYMNAFMLSSGARSILSSPVCRRPRTRSPRDGGKSGRLHEGEIVVPLAGIAVMHLVYQMHARYAGSWYHDLTFTQTTTFPRPARGDLV